MNHSAWNTRFDEATRLKANDPERAAAMLVELADEGKRVSEDGIGEWHEQQALGMAGMLLEEAGKLDRAEELYQRTLELCRLQTIYWSKATTSMLAIIAHMQFRQGRSDEATATGHDALRSLGHDPNPRADRMLADLMKEMTEHYAKRAASKRPDAEDKSRDG